MIPKAGEEITKIIFCELYKKTPYAIIFKSPRGIQAKDIGIISPYAHQGEKIRKELDKFYCKETKVGTVESFQGTLGVGWGCLCTLGWGRGKLI